MSCRRHSDRPHQHPPAAHRSIRGPLICKWHKVIRCAKNLRSSVYGRSRRNLNSFLWVFLWIIPAVAIPETTRISIAIANGGPASRIAIAFRDASANRRTLSRTNMSVSKPPPHSDVKEENSAELNVLRMWANGQWSKAGICPNAQSGRRIRYIA
jgi:hypothetical protein